MREIDFIAGLTIKEALIMAKSLAVNNNEPVSAIINEVVMIVDKNTDVEKALISYRKKLDFKHEIEKIKREKER